MYQIKDTAYSFLPLEQIDQKLMGQAIQVSVLPIIYRNIVLMPDAHLGSGAMVGSCIPTKGGLVPSAVGTDIGCGMIATRLNIKGSEFDMKNLKMLRGFIENDVPLSAGRYNKEYTNNVESMIKQLEMMAQNGHDRLDFYKKLSPNWRLQLGTLGSGNHFIELVTDEEDYVWAFLHSGSRGIGFKIGNYHIREAKRYSKENHLNIPNRDLAWLAEGASEFDLYLEDMHWAQAFASYNRAEMLDRVLRNVDAYMGEYIWTDTLIECVHNYSAYEKHFGETVWVTRKGAISAKKGELGLIPGSMGTRSYVVKGLGNPDSFCTAPHGAGRRFSRKEAKSRVTMDDFDRYMSHVEVARSPEFLDELPHAYKNIDEVIEQSKELVEVVHTFSQFLNVKGA